MEKILINEFLEIIRDKEATNKQLADVLKFIKDQCTEYKAENEVLRKRCDILEKKLGDNHKDIEQMVAPTGKPRGRPKKRRNKSDADHIDGH